MLAVYVDISSNNGTPNLTQYRDAGYTDLMLKATEGTGYYWPQMQDVARQWHAFGPGYRVGYYHWLYGTLTGTSQYLWFWAHVGPVFRRNPALDAYGRELGDWMMTDFEDVDPSRWVTDAQHLKVLSDFDGQCTQHGWVDDYAPDWYLANLPQCVAWLKANRRPVVASDYSNTPPGNRYGLNHVIHQYTDRASVPGMPTLVDQNRYLSGESTLSNGATQIGDQPMSQSEVQQILAALKDVPDLTATAVVNRNIQAAGYSGSVAQALATITQQDHRIGTKLQDLQSAVVAYIRGCTLALGGQVTTLPGEKQAVSSIGAVHQLEKAQLDALAAQLTELVNTVEKLAAPTELEPVASLDETKLATDLTAALHTELQNLTLTIGAKA